MTQWQPIETAPRDDVPVLVYAPDFHGGGPRVMEAMYQPYGWGDPVYNEWNCEPTHWMPLPEPPKVTE